MSNQAKLNCRPFLLATVSNSIVMRDLLLKKYTNEEKMKTSDFIFSTRAQYTVT